jgi:hypothetical protein
VVGAGLELEAQALGGLLVGEGAEHLGPELPELGVVHGPGVQPRHLLGQALVGGQVGQGVQG